jgi:hypothetical protein
MENKEPKLPAVRSIAWLGGWRGFEVRVEQKKFLDDLLCLAVIPE